jgi:hypothetical protein
MPRTRSSSAPSRARTLNSQAALLGDDVDRLSAVGHVPVHAHTVAEVDALPVDEAEGVEAGRERARPSWGRWRRARDIPSKSKVSQSDASVGVGDEVAVEGVEHHRRVDAVEDARLEHLDLPAPTLFGGRSEEDHLAAEDLRHRRSGDESPDAAGRDEVVPAGVTHPGQGVVLGENCDATGRPSGRLGRGRLSASPRCLARRRVRGRSRNRSATRSPCAPRSGARGARESCEPARRYRQRSHRRPRRSLLRFPGKAAA